ncbi:nascent polypeptide-associated complex subunit alpha, muscle-specific form-like isoform X2 [Ornithorhynchus anatinus]|uniref:nascent polypeptide-associated complex subunit alpha, muscle-specific form-like isoform X2 n=1 Tax=Ornithorhynchus anatinus TaxID=9258 RepID=UPI00045499F8|nr:nascent polypeptide-associated complex subunit alpha, muscle-specific form-like isoform X2 [Ornithorhynchus anatinus]
MWHDPDTSSEESDCTVCRRRSERARGRSAEDGTFRSTDSPPLAGKERATRPQTSLRGCRGSESHPLRVSGLESRSHPPRASGPESRSHPPRASGPESSIHPPQASGPGSRSHPPRASGPESSIHPPQASGPGSRSHPLWASGPGSRSHPPRASGPESWSHPPRASVPDSRSHPRRTSGPGSESHPPSASCLGSSHPPRVSLPEPVSHPSRASGLGSRSHPPRASSQGSRSHPPQASGPGSGPDLKGAQLAQVKEVQQVQQPVCPLSGQRSSEDSPERVLRVVYPEPEESWIEPQTSPQIPHPRRASFLVPNGHGAPGPLGSAERSGQTTATRPDCRQRGGKVDPAPSSQTGITPKAATRTPARAPGPRGESGWAPRPMWGPVLPAKRAPAFPRGPRLPEYRATGCGASPADPTTAAPRASPTGERRPRRNGWPSGTSRTGTGSSRPW